MEHLYRVKDHQHQQDQEMVVAVAELVQSEELLLQMDQE
tara:strand:- start:310 stop:426 length:117 start_codon:yes stop_codon:yes gene_type:complete